MLVNLVMRNKTIYQIEVHSSMGFNKRFSEKMEKRNSFNILRDGLSYIFS